MEWYIAMLIGALIGFPAGVLFRDAWVVFRDAAKEFNDETGELAVPKNRSGKVWMWIVVAFFSLIQIALGAGIVIAVKSSSDTTDCFVNLAESQNSTRNAWIGWTYDIDDLVRQKNPDPQDAQRDFLDTSATLRGELRDDNKQTNKCLGKVEDGWSPIG